MFKNKKTALLAGIIIIIVSGCANKENAVSPFDTILSQAHYAELTDSIKKEPKRDDLYFRRGVLLNSNDLTEPALADFKKAWSLLKNEKYAFGLANILLDKKPDSAIIFLNDALKELPESFLLQLTLARSYSRANKTDDALKICNTILGKNPMQVDVMKMKAELLDKKGNISESISILEKAYSITPYDIELNYELAYKYAENKNPRVISLCDSLIKIDTLQIHAEPFYYKGIYFSNTGDKAKALTLFDKAIAYDKYYMNAFIEKGRILYEQKKYTGAYGVFELANTLSNTFPDAYYWMGKCQEAMGQKEEAKLNYQRAYSLDNTFTDAKKAMDAIKN